MHDQRPVLPLLFMLVVGLLVAPIGCRGDLGEANNPVTLYIVPSETQGVVAPERLRASLETSTGLSVRLKDPGRYFDLVAAVGTEDADLLFMNDVSYLLAHEAYGAEAVLAVDRWDRGGTYRGAIIARADSSIDGLDGLDGKRIAYVDLHSMSGYVMPAVALSKAGVKPAEIVKAGTHDAVVRMVYDKQADAGFVYFNAPTADKKAHDARTLLVKEHPDVLDVVKVVATTKPIPNEPIVVGKHVPPGVRDKLVTALIGMSETADGRQILMDLHAIKGLHPVSDSDYDTMREGLKALGHKIDELVPGGGLLEVTHKTHIEPVPPVGG